MQWLTLHNKNLTSKPSALIIREIDLRGFDMRNSDCFCGSGIHHKKCHSEIKENSAISGLFEAFRIIDEDIANAAPAPACERGCAKCCGDIFEVSFVEYLAILSFIQKKYSGLSTYRLRSLQKAAASQLPLFSALKEHLKEQHGDTSDCSISGLRLTSPCIFLDNRGDKCKIYEVRPML